MTASQVALAKGRRLYCRYPLGVPATLVCGETEIECKIADLSLGGARLICDGEVASGANVFLRHDEMNCTPGLRSRVVKAYDDTLHVEFDLDGDMEEALLLFLMVSPQVPCPRFGAAATG